MKEKCPTQRPAKNMRSGFFILALVLALTSARLDLSPGHGTHSKPAAGLTDKQLGLLNWYAYILRGKRTHPTGATAAADQSAYSWPKPWTILDHQTGLSSVRYMIAFSAYAAAELSAAQTPAYPGFVSSILRDAFARLVSPTTWSYWDTLGMCGWPLTDVCDKFNVSMCEVNPHHPLDNHCPDPVKWQNVMYSAHLAHVGALYEAFSDDSSLTTAGWSFDGPPNRRRGVGPVHYTLPTLLEALAAQTRSSPTGGFACEPTIVYLVCNQHTYTAARLYDALHPEGGVGGKPYSSERAKWLTYLNRTAVRAKPKGLLGEGFFEILYQEQLRDLFPKHLPWVEIADLGGCAGNDGWAALALGFWVSDDDKTGGADLLRRARASLANNEAWKVDSITGGNYIHQRKWPYETQGYTNELATGWAPAALGGWNGNYADRVAAAFTYMEGTYGTPLDTDGDGVDDAWYYHTDPNPDTGYLDQMWATGGVGIGMARDDQVVADLYSGALMKRALSRPHLISVTPAAPAALVRRAVFESDANGDGTLHLTLTIGGVESLDGVELTIGVPSGWRRANASAHAPTFSMGVKISNVSDTSVGIAFVQGSVAASG